MARVRSRASRRPDDDRAPARILPHERASDDLRISLSDAAARAFLSPSRFAHLFRDQVGLPFSRYMLRHKLTRAMVAIGSERTLSAAAHAADFADAAHLTRTFYQMVGMAPSVLMRGEFIEITSAFSALPPESGSRRFPRRAARPRSSGWPPGEVSPDRVDEWAGAPDSPITRTC